MHVKTLASELCWTAVAAAKAKCLLQAASESCRLTTKLIFNTEQPELSTAAGLRSIVRAKTIKLVGAGKIGQATVLDTAIVTAASLKLSRRRRKNA